MNTSTQKKLIGNRLLIPTNSQAILWDMDGVLIDSLELSLAVCNQILSQHFGSKVKLGDAFIRSVFAHDIPTFWHLILEHLTDVYGIENALKVKQTVQAAYVTIRMESIFKTNPGILEILDDAKSNGLKMAVVSNNPTEEVKDTLNKSAILGYFDIVIGNDIEKFGKKPSPDTYIFAAKSLGIKSEFCVVIEDSLIGVESGHKAGCYTIGVATGGTDYDVLARSQWTAQVYSSFEEKYLAMEFGDVRKKKILTPNDFVSHMIEHIAWRLCVEIQLNWTSDDWQELGQVLGHKMRQFSVYQNSAAVLGMIDDGSAEVTIELTDAKPNLVITGIDTLDLEWFLSLRCEQLDSGTPLVELMRGLSKGLNAIVQVKICSVQDPHHTWEGVFRSIGIALNRIFTPKHSLMFPSDSLTQSAEESDNTRTLRILSRSPNYSKVFRGTAESHVIGAVDFSKQIENSFIFNVAPNIDVSNLHRLLMILSEQGGFTIQVEYNAIVLNSSHVVLEDTALVLGRALLEILMIRMTQWGVNGAGSSIQTVDDISTHPIHVGLSIEGRKFWLFVPFKDSSETLKRTFLVGQNIYSNLRSEDLDDFLDGLAGGLACSIIVHVHEIIDADEGWRLIFAGIGKSLKEAFESNPYRKGVPPGVKATLT